MKKVLLMICVFALLLGGCGSQVPAEAGQESLPVETAQQVDQMVQQDAETVAPETGLTEADKEEFREFLLEELAKRGQVKLEFVNEESECTDKNKLYVFPDNYIYECKTVEVDYGPPFTNMLTLAVDENGEPYTGPAGEMGYKSGHRLRSTKEEVKEDGMCCTGFIPVSDGDVIRIKNIEVNGSIGGYVFLFEEDRIKGAGVMSPTDALGKPENGVYTFTVSSKNAAYLRLSIGRIDETTILTVNEEINEEHVIRLEDHWINTGRTFLGTNYEDKIHDLEAMTAENTKDIERLLDMVGGGAGGSRDQLDWIRNWDAPIYDNTPVFLLDHEKPAVEMQDRTVEAIYGKYDALMASNPDFITRTDLGLSSDGETHVYRYDFREAEPHHQKGMPWSETKPKVIVVSGIHTEWGGIWSLYNAMEEITSNPELAQLRRNVHFIVVPALNPYCLIDYKATTGVQNFNGVEIHRNFEVAHAVTEEGTVHYGGPEPLTEVESQYLDKIFSENSDAAYFLSCHSNQRDTTWGTGFIWFSAGTKYMCNMGFRIIDKMSQAWHEKYGTAFEEGVARENAVVLADPEKYPNATALAEGDYRVGFAHVSSTPGTETRQATKYGIQAVNVEACDTFWVLDGSPFSAKAITHGAETYINFFLTAMDCYDYRDKLLYNP